MTTLPPTKPANHPQHGAAAIMLVLLVLLGLITILTFRLDRRQPELDADKKTAMALAQAKEALLGRAATDNTRPGSLRCPDLNNDWQLTLGVDFSSQCIDVIGRIPWKTLDMNDVADGAGEYLWYLLSPNFFDANGVKINTTTPGTLTLRDSMGNVIQGGLAAIVIAPGPALAGQARTGAGKNVAANYIEGYNPADDSSFTWSSKTAVYNDRIITITPAEISRLIVHRMTRELANFWNTPPGNYFPPPATSGIAAVPVPTTWSDNLWNTSAVVSVIGSTATTFTIQYTNCNATHTATISNSYQTTENGRC